MADGDPIVKALQKSSIAQTLKAARASLAEPSRPYTPLDRSLFQRPNEGSEPRPSSSYGVDQVTFVRDTFGARPESARSSRSRPDTIQEEGVDILRLDQEVESSGSEELTPVQATPPPAARATSGSLGASPSGPPKPPRPPGGYPGSGSRASLGGYPDGNEKSPMRLSSSSPRRRLASLSDAPGTPGSAGRRSGSGSRRAKGEDPAARLAQALELGSVPVARAPCEVVIGRLQSLKASKDKGLDKEDFAQLCDRILTLTKEMKAGQHVDSSAQLLREIMGLMDVKDLKESKYLFKLARCALALLSVDAATAGVPISGVQAAYQNIAQVLFKYSQKEGNDAEFLSAKLIEPLIEVLESTSDSCSSTDLRVYIVGILKNVSNDSANQKLLAQRGAVTALFKLMDGKILTGTPKEVPLLIQVTASLRNLASNQYKQFLTEDHLNALTNVMATYAGHVELLTNVARILAKLTLHDKAAEALARSDVHLRQIVQTVRSNMDSLALCLRLLFVLGNLAERSDRVRTVFAFDCEGTALVPELLGKYWQKERQHAAEKSKAGSAAGASEFEEVLVKLVRLLANVAISPSAGPTLAASSAVAEPLLDMLGAKRISDSEELVLNVVAAITNLLFYDVPANLLFHEESKQLLCRLFRPLLLESYNVEALVETARALGNLSRHADARRCMASLRLDEILVILLDHDDRDLVFYSCGALVNLAADSECIPRLAGSTPAVQKLAKLLGDAPCNDPMLQLVAVKVLTNLSLDSRAAWPMEDMELVRGVLAQSIADSQEVGDDHERQQLIDLARHLQGRLPAAPDPPAPAAPADAEWFYCRAEGCGRRFGSGEKLAAHVQRRHQQDEVLE